MMRKENKINCGVLTLSDKGYIGQRIDTSGKVIMEELKKSGFEIKAYKILPDDKNKIKKCLINWADKLKLDLIITTGGTGFSKRDNTPEATLEIIKKSAPGLSEYIRYNGYKNNPFASLSRGISGIRNNALIINLPGSEKAVQESMVSLKEILPHALEIIKGKTEH